MKQSRYKFPISAILVLFVLNNCSRHDNAGPATQKIIEIFNDHQLVALGESHGWKEESEFIFSLIRNPSFAKKVNDIVVECGNSKYQSLVDDYISGKGVPTDQLQKVWRNMTVLCTCDAPVYEQLFQTVRSVNQNLSPDHKLRVLVGEPPIDWNEIKSFNEVGPFIFDRDKNYAGIVEKEVINKNRKALLIMGSLHFIRSGWGTIPMATSVTTARNDTDLKEFTMAVDLKQKERQIKNMPDAVKAFNNPVPVNEDLNVVQILERKYRHKVFIILPYDGYIRQKDVNEVEKKFATSKAPYILPVKNTWIGNLDAGIFFFRESVLLQDGKAAGEVDFNPYPNDKVADLCDAYLYINNREKMTRSIPLAILNDSAYLKELNRRSMIINNQPFEITNYTDTSAKLHR